MPIQFQTRELETPDIVTDEISDSGYLLMVWNDDVNTFDWVIQTLIEVCAHDAIQAEQCAMMIHFNGKYGVSSGPFEKIKSMCEAICDRGISATIEEMPD
ncbi:MAG TPA: ATP-dependent Clp protease adaptor ClpS [Chitinophagaceae bacterium]|nr:ATP-dependent Clp protease adaptor ClpS [Chitinophagaceae bacterium]HNF72521.1 ATP-dependent Clp protease adaptor ClpS [Chitinophagaceae bacterium]